MIDKIKRRFGRNARFGRSMAEDRFGEDAVSMDGRGQTTAGGVISLIVALTVGGLVAAFLIPIAVDELAGTEAGGNWSDGAAALWSIIDVMIILAVFLFFTGIALAATNRV